MDYSKTIGIDVSKLTLDVNVLPDGKSCQVENNVKGITKLFRWLTKDCKVNLTDALFAFEHTGFYSYKLAVCLQEKGYAFVILSGLELKRSLGISRGKSDTTDAGRIAEYAILRKCQLVPTQMPEKVIEQMKRLLALRDKLVKQRAGYKASVGEAKQAIEKKEDPLYFKVQEDLIKNLDNNIDLLDHELLNLVQNHPVLKTQFDLIVSIKSVGTQTALFMIAVTHAFTKFANWRKFACYAGIAPFPYQSGTSIRGKTKVSHLANKKAKSILGNITGNAIQWNTEMKLYYQRRLAAGKNKMSTQNIIRNKLLARIFAVIDRGTPYVETMNYAA
jgi:transposase